MSVTVTLHVFSGRPDPSWELTAEQSAELVERIARLSRTTLLKPPGMLGVGTYRGFSLDAVREPTLQPHIHVHGAIVDLDRFSVNRVTDDGTLEHWLLETAGNNVEDVVRSYVAGEIDTAVGRDIHAQLARILAEPPFDPGKWNYNPTITRQNNCYNYANDKIRSSFAQPGRGSGQVFTAFSCANVQDASRRDGQVRVSSVSSTPAQGHFIALVMWPGVDYHWYRRDSSGTWSEKRGETPCKNRDESGRIINDPQTCDRGAYTEFCAYFHCIPANTVIG
jgi:hypothetical protein